MTSKGVDQVSTIQIFSSLVLCLFPHPGLRHHGAAPFLSDQHDDDASGQRSFPSSPSQSKLADDSPAVLFVDPSSASMGTNIKQPETPRRVLEWEAVQTLCKILLSRVLRITQLTINYFSSAYNAHPSHILTYLNTIMKPQHRNAWPSSSWKRHYRWDLWYVPKPQSQYDRREGCDECG